MKKLNIFAAAVIAAFCVSAVQAQQKVIKVGVIYDYTGAFAAGGSEAAGIGTKIAIDMLNEKGGIEGYRINAIYVDAQSKTEVAINETSRLLDQEFNRGLVVQDELAVASTGASGRAPAIEQLRSIDPAVLQTFQAARAPCEVNDESLHDVACIGASGLIHIGGTTKLVQSDPLGGVEIPGSAGLVLIQKG